METLTLYKVFGEDTGCYPVHRGTFINLKDACKYAVANSGVIAYGLPEVYQENWYYDRHNQKMTSTITKIETGQVYYMNQL